MKKEWGMPELRDLSVDLTNAIEYVDYCNWVPTEMTGVCNEDYTDPNKKPSQHPTWVWCHVHNRWHPKDHGASDSTVSGS